MILLISVLIAGGVSSITIHIFSFPSYLNALLGGLAIIAAGYALSVAVEVAQKDISRSLATIILALIAVLPEYAVDVYLAFMGGKDPQYIHYATANMTGANRMLLGLFWPVVAFVGIYLARSKRAVRSKAILLDRSFHLEIFFLMLATLYSFKLAILDYISIFDSTVLILIFLGYARIASQQPPHEGEFEGVVDTIAGFSAPIRRSVVTFLFLISAAVIISSVEPFTEGLIDTGKLIGISEYLLIQWVAPIASELPELIVTLILAFRGETTAAIGALVSSKVNQWTLLISTLPVAYSVGSGRVMSMPLDAVQREEIFLTAAQSLFGTLLIADLKLSRMDALLLFILFWGQWVYPTPQIRTILGWIYIALALVLVIRDRSRISTFIRYGKNLLS